MAEKVWKFVPNFCWHLQRKTAAVVQSALRPRGFNQPIRISQIAKLANRMNFRDVQLSIKSLCWFSEPSVIIDVKHEESDFFSLRNRKI